jgi:cell division protease FtsH
MGRQQIGHEPEQGNGGAHDGSRAREDKDGEQLRQAQQAQRQSQQGQQGQQPRSPLSNWRIWLLFAALAIWNIWLFWPSSESPTAAIPYSVFLEQVQTGNVRQVTIQGADIKGEFVAPVAAGVLQGTSTAATSAATPGQGTPAATDSTGSAASSTYSIFRTTFPDAVGDPTLMPLLTSHNVVVNVKEQSTPWFLILLNSAFPLLLLLGLVVWMGRQAMQSQQGIFSFGRTQARKNAQDRPKTSFKDVAGADEAKAALSEEVEFLRNPEKFYKLGARIPRGTLLVGPPGTGKTLLARAVAGEAHVPFFSISGSEFVQLFVGVGASRVRDLFDQAKEAAPSIIFIDELDAVARSRGGNVFGTNDEREQTLNQLLVEMDGFDERQQVIVLSATNRPDVLDPALLRPGRFDRQIEVPLPERKGREGILRIHTRDIPLAPDVSLSELADMTTGFSGADLENLCNEAALLAAARNANQVTLADCREALDKVRLGGVRPLALSEAERRVTAYHEGGHTVVAWRSPGADPVEKVTIIPRGRALGVTEQVPERDRYSFSLSYLTTRLAIMVAGRAAEEIVFGDVTTGAQSDLTQATRLARQMVTQWGMGSVGLAAVEGDDQQDRYSALTKPYSEATAALIDADVQRLLDDAHKRARDILTASRAELDRLAAALLKSETVYSEGLVKILGPQPAAPDLTPKQFAPDGRVPEEIPSLVSATSGPV